MKRVMWIGKKSGSLSLVGPAKIGWVEVKEKGKRLEYQKQIFRSLRAQGYKTNFFDMKPGEEYWISGCRNGRDALYNTDVEIDENALEEYWLHIRHMPEHLEKKKFRASGKY